MFSDLLVLLNDPSAPVQSAVSFKALLLRVLLSPWTRKLKPSFLYSIIPLLDPALILSTHPNFMQDAMDFISDKLTQSPTSLTSAHIRKVTNCVKVFMTRLAATQSHPHPLQHSLDVILKTLKDPESLIRKEASQVLLPHLMQTWKADHDHIVAQVIHLLLNDYRDDGDGESLVQVMRILKSTGKDIGALDILCQICN